MTIPYDLLQPTLTEADDLGDMDRPWTPNTLAVLLLICGPIAGGVLMAWNEHRLGRRQRVAPTLLAFALLGIAKTTILFGLLVNGWIDADNRTHVRGAHFVANVIAVAFALYIARTQDRRFRLWLASGNEAAPLLRYGVAAFLVGMFLDRQLVSLVAWIFLEFS